MPSSRGRDALCGRDARSNISEIARAAAQGENRAGTDRSLNPNGHQRANRTQREHLLRRAEVAGVNEMAEIAPGQDRNRRCAELWKDELLPPAPPVRASAKLDPAQNTDDNT